MVSVRRTARGGGFRCVGGDSGYFEGRCLWPLGTDVKWSRHLRPLASGFIQLSRVCVLIAGKLASESAFGNVVEARAPDSRAGIRQRGRCAHGR